MKAICILLQNQYDMDIRVRRKAEALVAAGYAVDVLALRGESKNLRCYQLNGVQVHTIALGKRRGSLYRYIFEYLVFLVWAAMKLERLYRQTPYAVVDVNNLPDFLVFAALPAKRKGARVVFDMHEITPEFFMSKYRARPESRLVQLARLIERASVNFAHHVITINQPILQLLIERGYPDSKLSVIMNCADEELFREPAAGWTEPVASTGKTGFIFMYHGTLTQIYGLDIAIEAFAQARKQMPNAEFWILGNGPESEALREKARRLGVEAEVRFLGSVIPSEIPTWLHHCDVGVLATRQDIFLELSFSNKLSEYVIMNKPVIASRLRTIRHYFSDQAIAFFKPECSQELEVQMIRLYRDAKVRSELAYQARQEYKPIRWPIMRSRYLSLMERLTTLDTEEEIADQTPPDTHPVCATPGPEGTTAS